MAKQTHIESPIKTGFTITVPTEPKPIGNIAGFPLEELREHGDDIDLHVPTPVAAPTPVG